MKPILLALILALSINALASPRLDTAIGTPEPNIITVVPDSADANLYYLFPQRYGLATDPAGRFRFAYQEYADGWFSILANVEMVFTPLFDKDLVDAKVKAIKTLNPNAKFAFVPVVKSSVVAPSILFPAIEESDCKISGMVIGQDIVCHQTINDSGRRLFMDRFRNGLMNVFQLNYQFAAAVTGQNILADHSIAMYGGGVADPSYYLDRKGRPRVFNTNRFGLFSAPGTDMGDENTYIDREAAKTLWGIETN